jgi:hypothetical protein
MPVDQSRCGTSFDNRSPSPPGSDAVACGGKPSRIAVRSMSQAQFAIRTAHIRPEAEAEEVPGAGPEEARAAGPEEVREAGPEEVPES